MPVIGIVQVIYHWPPTLSYREGFSYLLLPGDTAVNSKRNFLTRLSDWFHEYFLRNCSHVNYTEPIGDKLTLVQVMAWCHQATSHYLSQCWPRSVLPYCVTRPQGFKFFLHVYFHSFSVICSKKTNKKPQQNHNQLRCLRTLFHGKLNWIIKPDSPCL